MSIFDIIIGVLLLWAAYQGFRDGTFVQLGGIVGLILGVYMAFRFGQVVGCWIGLEGVTAKVVGFMIIILVVILGMALIGRITRGILRFAGLGVMDSVIGMVLGAIKMGILISVLLIAFETLNEQTHWVDEDAHAKSKLYEPIKSVAKVLFPYLEAV